VFQMASLEPEDDKQNGTYHEGVPSGSPQIQSDQGVCEGTPLELSSTDAAIASTPIGKHTESVKGSSTEASWIASIESPHEQLQSQLTQLMIDAAAPNTQLGHYGKHPFHSQAIQPPWSSPPHFVPPDPNNATTSMGTPSSILSLTPPASELSKLDIRNFVPIFKQAQIQKLLPAKLHIVMKRVVDEVMHLAYFELQSIQH